ncbi:MAG: O-antigen ligase family protein [Nitrolancea sp.]
MRSSTLSLPSTRVLWLLFGLALAAASGWVVLRAPSPVNLGFFPGVAFGLAVVLVPWLGPLILALSVPVQQFGSVSMGGVGLTATKVAIAASLAAFLIQIVSRREALRGSILLVPFVAWYGAMSLSLRGAVDMNAGFAELYRWGVALFALVVALYGIRTGRAVIFTSVAMGLGVVFEGLLGVVQTVKDIGPSSFAVTNSVSRAFGTFGKPNTFAAYFELTGPLMAALAVWSLRRAYQSLSNYRLERRRGMELSAQIRHELIWFGALALWFGFSTAISLAAIVASFSRGAWLGTAAAIAVMLIISDRRGALAVGALTIVVVLGGLAGGASYAPVALKDRFQQLESQVRFFDSRDVMVTDANFAAVERMAHWQTGIAMFDARPFTGVGIGNFNARFTEFAVNPKFTISEGHAHNYYINAAAETGIVGLVAYLWLILTGLWVSLRAVRRSGSDFGRAVGVGAVGVTVALMVHNVVENLHVLNLGVQLSIVWALAIIVTRLLPDEPVSVGSQELAGA